MSRDQRIAAARLGLRSEDFVEMLFTMRAKITRGNNSLLHSFRGR